MALNDYEDTLKSYIHDDDKLVTYKWLSKEFEIHVNVAKHLLKQYWEKNKDEEKIVATFLLVGQLKDGLIRVEVVKEENLSIAKKKFVKLDCEHMYSLQKALQDIELLALAGDGDLRFSAIKCNDEYVRSNEEIESLRYIGNIKKDDSKHSNKLVNEVPEKQAPKPVDYSAKENIKNVINKKHGIKEKEMPEEKEKPVETKTEIKTSAPEKKVSPKSNSSNNTKVNNKVSKKPVQSKQSGFNNLFGKASSKPPVLDTAKEDSDDSNNQKNTLDNIKEEELMVSKEKDTKLFNNKEDEKKVQEKEKDKTKDGSEKEKDKAREKSDKEKAKAKDSLEKEKAKARDSSEKEKVKARDRSEKENENRQSEKKSKNISKTESKVNTKSKNKKDARGKKRNRSQEKHTSSKRKRIVVIDSSEDESAKSNDEDEEEQPMEIDEEPIKVTRKRSPSPPAEKRENGKRMVSKYIDKTFKDEDGYLVTKRIQVYEVASDNEESVEVKKEETQKPKPVEVKAKKQTTLMNFFKKS